MKRYRLQAAAIGGFLSLALIAATPALGATSLSNSLTGFTGNSTLPATQAAVGAAGFNFFSTAGLDEEFTMDPTVVLDSSGVTFGSLFGGDNGRNYVRTNDSDYATVPFVAEITLTLGGGGTAASSQQVFFGMGSGDTALFGVPDWSTLLASTFVSPEVSPEGVASLTTFRTQNDANVWVNNPVSGYGTGTHRVQMTFNPIAKTMTYALDLNFAGGAFSADFTATDVDLNHIDCPVGCGFPEMPISADFFAPDGWPTEPSRIYWGGDDGVTYKDFSVTVSAPPAVLGDYNNNGKVDAADYVLWRNGGPLLNEVDTPGTVNAADYTEWRARFGNSGSGSGLVAGSAIPEPTSIGIALAMIGCLIATRRGLVVRTR